MGYAPIFFKPQEVIKIQGPFLTVLGNFEMDGFLCVPWGSMFLLVTSLVQEGGTQASLRQVWVGFVSNEAIGNGQWRAGLKVVPLEEGGMGGEDGSRG